MDGWKNGWIDGWTDERTNDDVCQSVPHFVLHSRQTEIGRRRDSPPCCDIVYNSR